VHRSGTFTPGAGQTAAAALMVHRLGFGTMRLTGRGIWGEPTDRHACLRLLRRAVDLGVDLIGAADSYGPYVSEDLIREALHPYPDHLVIATQAGLVPTGPHQWHPVGRPDYLRREVEKSLRRLAVERIDLFQLLPIDPRVPAPEQFGLLADLVREGKVRLVGVSCVTVTDVARARGDVRVATVQNRYHLTDRSSDDVLAYCEIEGLGFMPWYPTAAGQLAQPGQLAQAGGAVGQSAEQTGGTPSQVALAWLLARSPVMLPIPGAASGAHVEENTGPAGVTLTADQVASLTSATLPAARPG
jgi:pyridoxine 4-dehydrogenase